MFFSTEKRLFTLSGRNVFCFEARQSLSLHSQFCRLKFLTLRVAFLKIERQTVQYILLVLSFKTKREFFCKNFFN